MNRQEIETIRDFDKVIREGSFFAKATVRNLRRRFLKWGVRGVIYLGHLSPNPKR